MSQSKRNHNWQKNVYYVGLLQSGNIHLMYDHSNELKYYNYIISMQKNI